MAELTFQRAAHTEGDADAAAVSRTRATTEPPGEGHAASASPELSPESSTTRACRTPSESPTTIEALKLVIKKLTGDDEDRRELRKLVRTLEAESSQRGGIGGDADRSSARAADAGSGELIVSDDELFRSSDTQRRVKVATLPGNPNLTNAQIESMEDAAAKALYAQLFD
jgi:hypothetical protein